MSHVSFDRTSIALSCEMLFISVISQNALFQAIKLGKGSKLRPLRLPTVDDKLVQQGVSQIQGFLPNSYGYRSSKSVLQAVGRLMLCLQFKGYGYIVEADIKGFFDNMGHD